MNVHVRDNLNYLKSAADNPIVQTSTLGAPLDNFALTAGCSLLWCTNTVDAFVTGFTAGVEGQRLDVVSAGTGLVEIQHEGVTSTAANRCKNFATSGTTMLAAGTGMAQYRYGGATPRWRLVAHEQGAWISPAFAAGHYTSPTGTWVVASGDVTNASFRLSGRTLQMRFYLVTTDVTGTPVTLNRVIPGGYTAAGGDPATPIRATDAATAVGLAQAAGTAVLFYSTIAGGGWTAGAGRAIECHKTIEVT
jgi:hypothetical protein